MAKKKLKIETSSGWLTISKFIQERSNPSLDQLGQLENLEYELKLHREFIEAIVESLYECGQVPVVENALSKMCYDKSVKVKLR